MMSDINQHLSGPFYDNVTTAEQTTGFTPFLSNHNKKELCKISELIQLRHDRFISVCGQIIPNVIQKTDIVAFVHFRLLS